MPAVALRRVAQASTMPARDCGGLMGNVTQAAGLAIAAVGASCRTKAASPETSAAAKEVPETKAYPPPGVGAGISRPGAIKAGITVVASATASTPACDAGKPPSGT